MAKEVAALDIKFQNKKSRSSKRKEGSLLNVCLDGFHLIAFVLVGMIIMFLKGMQTADSDKPKDAKAAQVEVFNGQDTRDGVNILILGTDGRIGQNSAETRTDSIMVLNVSGKDKKLSL